MTAQYLIGELSVWLEQLQAAAGQAAARDVPDLRYEVETGPVTWLAAETIRALSLADQLCWDWLSRGDVSAFARQAAICADLHLVGVCALLLEED